MVAVANQEERPNTSPGTRACQENETTPVGYPESNQTQHLPNGPAKVKVNAKKTSKNRANSAQTLPPREHEPNPISPSNWQQQSAIFSATVSTSVRPSPFWFQEFPHNASHCWRTCRMCMSKSKGSSIYLNIAIQFSFNCVVGLSACPSVTSISTSTDQKVGKLVQANQTKKIRRVRHIT